MKASQVVLQGTLKSDGTLELSAMPTLPAGPVEVLIRSQHTANGGVESWWEFLQRSRAELLENGMTFRSKAEIDADRSRHRSQDEARREALVRQQTPED